ncbi:MAG: endonuclease/exonuclease/phosphatase family protein [Bacteroidota bacterium]|nr:endonuclease/exonuclease/phosphatase family protein [Bacteroidota bacterium]
MSRILLLSLLLFFQVGSFSQSLSDVEFGSDSTVDVLTWNLEWFPKNNQITIDSLAVIIESLNADVLAIQEINNINQFNLMVNSLPNYEGYISNSNSGSLRLGFIYKNHIDVNGIFSIYSDPVYSYIFAGRPPIIMDINVFGENFIIINNHFKCCGDGILNVNDSTDEETRRYYANRLIKQYIDSNYTTTNIILLGDLNDRLDDNILNNVFQEFINDSTNFKFCDIAIAYGSTSFWSYPSWPSHLDHILISNELFSAFYHNLSEIKTLRIDSFINGGFSVYDAIISDHLPVGLKLYMGNISSLNNNSFDLKKK